MKLQLRFIKRFVFAAAFGGAMLFGFSANNVNAQKTIIITIRTTAVTITTAITGKTSVTASRKNVHSNNINARSANTTVMTVIYANINAKNVAP